MTFKRLASVAIGWAIVVGTMPMEMSAQSDPSRPPTPEELVQALIESPTLGAKGVYLSFTSCPWNGRESEVLTAISRASLPVESLVALGVNWSDLYGSDCPPIVSWFEDALRVLATAGDNQALEMFLLRLPEDISISMREQLRALAEDQRYNVPVREQALIRAIQHSDESARLDFAIAAFESISGGETAFRSVIAVESGHLLDQLGGAFVQALAQAGSGLSDAVLSAAVTPLVRYVSEQDALTDGDLNSLAQLRSVVRGRPSIEHLAVLLTVRNPIEDGNSK